MINKTHPLSMLIAPCSVATLLETDDPTLSVLPPRRAAILDGFTFFFLGCPFDSVKHTINQSLKHT